MNLFDTLSKTKKELDTTRPVSFYQCGPTMYWNQHIGNMRSVVVADLLVRSIQHMGGSVNFVRNYTDVGHLSGDNEGDADTGVDRMEKAAVREQKTPEEIFERYKQAYLADLEKLGVQSPTYTPRATEHIQEMISLVSMLLEKGHAYQTEHAIYFDISTKDDYTKLSGQNLDKLLSGTGHGDVQDSNKKHPGDFALWFFKSGTHEQALQTWTNPFSDIEGFPGWHIECSAMAHKYLGATLDIHMGGIEHIPIHHTNEIAQSECGYGQELARIWLHNEHLLVNGKKMSKSEGTSYLVSDIEEHGYSPLDLRYLFLQAHYRSKQNFTWDALDASAKARKKIIAKYHGYPGDGGKPDTSTLEAFSNALQDDLNTPRALSVLFDVIASDLVDRDKRATLAIMDAVLELGLDRVPNKGSQDIPAEVIALVEEREQARLDKDWNLSDTLREKIAEWGYTVTDDRSGTIIDKK